MDKQKLKSRRRTRRRIGIRKRIVGTAECPRLSVYRSLNHIYAQIIDDLNGRTLVAASTRDKDIGVKGSTGNASAAGIVGAKLAEKAKAAGIERVKFDRGGFKYHGRVKALAEAAREGGLTF